MTMTIYTLGYGAGWTLPQLRAAISDYNAVVCDIRLNPFSKRPGWSRQELFTVLTPTHYMHVPALGNLDYKDGGIRLQCVPAGISIIDRILARRSVIMLCGCAHVDQCHRLVAANEVSAALDVPVLHLDVPERKRV